MNNAELLTWLLLLIRTASTIALLQPFAGGPVPAPVKIGLAAALTLAWAPEAAVGASSELESMLTSPQAGWVVGWFALRETIAGAAIAWVLSLVFVPLRVAGAYIGQEMGLTLGGLSSPVDEQQSNVITQMLEVLGTLAFFVVDGHHLMLRAVRRTLDLFPVGMGGSGPDAAWIVRGVSGAEQLGLELAAPIGVGLFLILTFSLLVMRAVPQFNLLTFGMPLRLAAGLLLLILLWPDLLGRATGLLQNFATF